MILKQPGITFPKPTNLLCAGSIAIITRGRTQQQHLPSYPIHPPNRNVTNKLFLSLHTMHSAIKHNRNPINIIPSNYTAALHARQSIDTRIPALLLVNPQSAKPYPPISLTLLDNNKSIPPQSLTTTTIAN